MKHTHPIVLVLLFAITAGTLQARAREARVTRLDGTPVKGELESLSPTGIRIRQATVISDLEFDEIAAIQFEAVRSSPSPADKNAVFHLASGGRVNGLLIDGFDETLVVQPHFGGRLFLPFSALAAVQLHGHEPPQAQSLFDAARTARLPGKDVLIAAGSLDLRSLRGTLVHLDPEGGKFLFNGRVRAIQPRKMFGVVFAAGGKTSDPPPHSIRLTHGDELRGTIVEASLESVRLDAGLEEPIDLRLGDLASIEFRNERVVFLSDLVPASRTETGIVHDGWQARNDRNVLNGPISLGGRTYAKGLGVHARSELVYELGGQFETLAATIGIDDRVKPAGNVRFLVLADGRTVFESGPVTGSDSPRDVRVMLDGAGWLSLIVECGDDADVADWADWAAARLIRPKSSS